MKGKQKVTDSGSIEDSYITRGDKIMSRFDYSCRAYPMVHWLTPPDMDR